MGVICNALICADSPLHQTRLDLQSKGRGRGEGRGDTVIKQSEDVGHSVVQHAQW